jgi:glycosyltransferase involved in cell wall biosynthesis
MAPPAITVLMPAYNAAPYVRAAVTSVLAQTWTDLELLVVNDGSTDGTREILAAIDDRRLRVVDTDNRGVGAALRLGVELARGRYLARMDADDECLPHRLAVQQAHLDAHPGTVLVHALARAIGGGGRLPRGRLGLARPSAETQWLLCWRNVPIHPTVMLRADVLRAHGLNYRDGLDPAEDFDLWNRLAPHGAFDAIPEILLRYRLQAGSVTRADGVDRQLAVYARVIGENFARHGLALPPGAAEELAVISGGSRRDPIAHRYPVLAGRLHGYLEALSSRFCASRGVAPRQLAGVQAWQLCRWARYLLNTSRAEAATLLRLAVCRRPGVAGTYLFWAVLAGLALPAPAREALGRLRAGSAR